MYNLDSKIKDWYIENYPDDKLGKEIYDGITFRELEDALYSGIDNLAENGLHDSIIRERVFYDGLAAIDKGIDEETIYTLWLNSLPL